MYIQKDLYKVIKILLYQYHCITPNNNKVDNN